MRRRLPLGRVVLVAALLLSGGIVLVLRARAAEQAAARLRDPDTLEGSTALMTELTARITEWQTTPRGMGLYAGLTTGGLSLDSLQQVFHMLRDSTDDAIIAMGEANADERLAAVDQATVLATRMTIARRAGEAQCDSLFWQPGGLRLAARYLTGDEVFSHVTLIGLAAKRTALDQRPIRTLALRSIRVLLEPVATAAEIVRVTSTERPADAAARCALTRERLALPARITGDAVRRATLVRWALSVSPA